MAPGALSSGVPAAHSLVRILMRAMPLSPLPDETRYMRRALDLATGGWGRTSPNPLVGCVLVRDGEIVGEGFHREWGGLHAEAEALANAGDAARGSTAYVTLEPCAHSGKRPPCAPALIAAGVARVVIATADPNPVARGGADLLQAAGIDVELGLLQADARELNAPFLFALHADRPWVTLKLALSLDGAIADVTRAPAWLTGPESRREVHRLRAGSDAVAIGLGTARTDDPSLTVRDWAAPRVAPLRVVFDRRAELPLDSRLVRTAASSPVVVVVGSSAAPAALALLQRAGVIVLVADDPMVALRALRAEHGVRSLLVEGGAGLASALWGAGLVDRLITFRAPVVLGAGALPAFGILPPVRAGGAPRLPVLERRVLGDDSMTVYAITAL